MRMVVFRVQKIFVKQAENRNAAVVSFASRLCFPPMKATWHGATLAENNDTVVVEGNHYFPRNSLNSAHFRESTTHTICPWKGEASYYDVVVNGEVNKDAAWYYPNPKEAAIHIKDRVSFWKGIVVE